MITGKDHRLLGDFPPDSGIVVLNLFLGLKEDEVVDEIHEAVTVQNLPPQIGGPVSVGIGWIAGAAVDIAGIAAAIERQEKCFCSIELGGHVDLFGVDGKMYDSAFLEEEQRSMRISVSLILVDGIAPGLAGRGIFEFQRHQGNTVQREQHIDGAVVIGVAGNLPGDMKLILIVKCQSFRIHSVCGFEISKFECFPVKFESVPDDVHGPLVDPLFEQSFDEETGQLCSVELFHLRPELRLSPLYETEDIFRKDSGFFIPERLVANAPSAVSQSFLNITFESLF